MLEKSASATNLMLGREDLKAWRGDLTAFPGPDFYLGPPGVGRVRGRPRRCWSRPSWACGARRATARAALGAAIAGGLVLGLYFRLRTYGEYFDLKVLSFLTPLLLVATVPWLAERLSGPRTAARYVVVAAVGLVLALQLAGLREELGRTALQVDRETFVLRDVARTLPPGQLPGGHPAERAPAVGVLLPERAPAELLHARALHHLPARPRAAARPTSSWPTRR